MNMRFQSGCFFAVILAAGLVVGGCRSKQSGQSQSANAQAGITYTYHLRGIIKALPRQGQSAEGISIKTEAIGNWMGPDGKREPMMAMTMPYQLAKNMTLHSIAVGDKVAFTYKVNWTADQMVITRISKLPAGTALNFSMR